MVSANLLGRVQIRGAEKMRLVGRDLRAAGEEGRGLRLELFAAIRTATEPARERVRESARATLPKTGGLNEWVAKSTIRTSSRLTGRLVGVRITGRRGNVTNLWKINRGFSRHPLFGNRDHWYENVDKPFTAGFFSDPLEEMRPAIMLGVIGALERTRRQVEKL